MTPKERYFQKKYNEAPEVPCACGCGTIIKSMDRYARPKTFVSGHNGQKYEHTDDSSKAAKKRWKKRNPEWIKEDKKARYRRLKLKAMEYLGNKCHHCSLAYNGRNAPGFEFHHFDPSIKDGLVTKMLINKSWETTQKEIDKCHLLCAICHNIHHGGEW